MVRESCPRPLRGPRFRAWELVYLAALAALLAVSLWSLSAVVAVLLALHVATWRLTRCGVRTTRGRPCRWLVRGALRSCDFHTGQKRGLPRPSLVGGDLLPRPVWRPARPGLWDDDPQPGGTESRALVLAPNARGAYGHLARLPFGLVSGREGQDPPEHAHVAE